MTTIEELKLQKKSCEDLGLTVDAENIRQRIAKLESNLSGEMPTDSGMPSIPEKETSENPPDVAIVESPEVEAQETQTVEPKPQAAATDKKKGMYPNTKTWNPAVGCKFACKYCEPTFQAAVAWSTQQRRVNCDGCLKYYPHEHPERLSKFPSEDIIFAFGNGDISFYSQEFVEKAIDSLIVHLQRSRKSKTVYFQSKDPKCLAKYFDRLIPIKDSVVMLTTLETNRDEGYSDISKAPLPSDRYRDFLNLDWKRKIVTIEPVMDFDLDEFVNWIQQISPEAVYLGFNSKPEAVKLPEPSPEKFWQLQNALSSFVEVRLKDTRNFRCGVQPQITYTQKTISELTESERAEFEKMNIAPADVDQILSTPYGLVVNTGGKRWMKARLGKQPVSDVEMAQLKADYNTVLAKLRALEKGMTSADLPAHKVLMDKLSGIHETIVFGGYEITPEEARHGLDTPLRATRPKGFPSHTHHTTGGFITSDNHRIASSHKACLE